MGEIGSRLREARQNRGLSLEQVEDATRIRRIFLEALEEEKFDQLPADVYARGFLRNYARFLGLDPDPLLKAYRPSYARNSVRLPAVLDEPLRESTARSIGTALFWGLVVVVILGLGLWYGYQEFYLGTTWGPRPAPSVVPVETLPAETSAPAGAAVQSQPTEMPTPTSAPAATEPDQTTAVVQAPATASPTRGSALTQTRTATVSSPSATGTAARGTPAAQTPTRAASAQATRTMPSPEDGIPVAIRVSDRSYVSVVVDGAKVMEAILEPGEDQAWAFKRTFSMRVGNAGGVQVTLNSVEMPPLGRPGQVLTVDYAADNLPLN